MNVSTSQPTGPSVRPSVSMKYIQCSTAADCVNKLEIVCDWQHALARWCTLLTPGGCKSPSTPRHTMVQTTCRHVSLPSHASVSMPSHMTALTKVADSITSPCGSYQLLGPNTHVGIKCAPTHSPFTSNYEDWFVSIIHRWPRLVTAVSLNNFFKNEQRTHLKNNDPLNQM